MSGLDQIRQAVLTAKALGQENRLTKTNENAQKEEAYYYNQLNRDDSEHKNMHWIFKVFIWAGASLLLIGVFIRFWHLICPEKWCWISPDRISSLDSSVIALILGGVFGNVGTRMLNRRNRKKNS